MFQNRQQAGIFLAEKLKEYKNNKDVIILAIPRGGMVVGREIAIKLNILLSVIVVKKLSAPYNPELAIGAVAPDGVKVVDWDLALRVGVEQNYFDREIGKKRGELKERIRKFRMKNSELRMKDEKIIILVDDGVATGATALAAIKYIKEHRSENIEHRTKIILSVPVIARDTYYRLNSEVDELVALEIPESFGAVGQFYREFPQITDDEVINILSNHRQ